jgi:hypothetical protein
VDAVVVTVDSNEFFSDLKSLFGLMSAGVVSLYLLSILLTLLLLSLTLEAISFAPFVVRLKGVFNELCAEYQDIDGWGLKKLFSDDRIRGLGGNGNAVWLDGGWSGSEDVIEPNKWDPNGLDARRGEQLNDGLQELTIAGIECLPEDDIQTQEFIQSIDHIFR